MTPPDPTPSAAWGYGWPEGVLNWLEDWEAHS